MIKPRARHDRPLVAHRDCVLNIIRLIVDLLLSIIPTLVFVARLMPLDADDQFVLTELPTVLIIDALKFRCALAVESVVDVGEIVEVAEEARR